MIRLKIIIVGLVLMAIVHGGTILTSGSDQAGSGDLETNPKQSTIEWVEIAEEAEWKETMELEELENLEEVYLEEVEEDQVVCETPEPLETPKTPETPKKPEETTAEPQKSTNADPIQVSSKPAPKNPKTDNLNILFIGVDGDDLLMTSLYSIDNKDSWRSAAIFIPSKTLLTAEENPLTLSQTYRGAGAHELVKNLSTRLGVEIDYYVEVDRKVLVKVQEIIDPIYVEGEKVQIVNLFNMEVTPHDEYILGELLQRLSQPRVYFLALPELFVTFRRHITTDFAITPNNLYIHYQITRNILPQEIKKTILTGAYSQREGELVLELPPDTWNNVIYDMTKKALPQD